jgi:DNA-binding NarL/FixJ family response regulator
MKIAIADDHGIFRTSISRALKDLGLSVPVSVTSGTELLKALENAPIDVAVVDINMPPGGPGQGLQTARELKSLFPSVAILLLSADTATKEAIALLQDFDRGIGYLRKDEVDDVEQLHRNLQRLLAGEQVMGSSVVDRLLRASRNDKALSSLTSQETDVLRLMAEGYSNAGIAKNLHLAERTVEDYVSRIFTKLKIGASEGGPSAAASNRRVLAVLTWLRLTTSS